MIGAMMNYLVNSGGALYFFVDPDTGDYTKCKADSPLPYPADKNLYIECECVRSGKYHIPSGLEDEVTMSSTYTKSAEIPSDDDYRNWGILISGGFIDELEGKGMEGLLCLLAQVQNHLGPIILVKM